MGSDLRVSKCLTRKLQVSKLPGWTIRLKFHAANYRRFTVIADKSNSQMYIWTSVILDIAAYN